MEVRVTTANAGGAEPSHGRWWLSHKSALSMSHTSSGCEEARTAVARSLFRFKHPFACRARN